MRQTKTRLNNYITIIELCELNTWILLNNVRDDETHNER